MLVVKSLCFIGKHVHHVLLELVVFINPHLIKILSTFKSHVKQTLHLNEIIVGYVSVHVVVSALNSVC